MAIRFRHFHPAVPFCHLRFTAAKPAPAAYPREADTPGKRLRRTRLDLGLTQKELADVLGVTSDTIRNWELDRTSPGVRHVAMLDNFPTGFTVEQPDPEETFPMRLARLRRRLGLTQRELAAELDVDASTVWHWERGLHRPIRRHREGVEALLHSLDHNM